LLPVLIILAIVILVVLAIISIAAAKKSVAARPVTARREAPTLRGEAATYTYRVRRDGRTTTPGITFKDPARASVTIESLEGLHDGLTGRPLDTARGLYRCEACAVYYHTSSFEELKEENEGRCVVINCKSRDIRPVVIAQKIKLKFGRDLSPLTANVANYTQHFGSVVIFEGSVVSVRAAHGGQDFAAMLEDKPWNEGLKLMFLSKSLEKVGGAAFINGLSGRTVRVRGLLINHAVLGPEIIVTEREMILEVR
jgi:hypothetical protein